MIRTALAALAAAAFAAVAHDSAEAQTVGACPQPQVAQYISELSAMSTASENSIRYLVPKFRECGQGVIASELAGTPDWLAQMRQHLQAQSGSAPELKTTIETALGNLHKAESSLQKNYSLVLQGIDSMYDNRFPPACRRERTKIVDNMKSTRPQVPAAIVKLNSFKSCLGG